MVEKQPPVSVDLIGQVSTYSPWTGIDRLVIG